MSNANEREIAENLRELDQLSDEEEEDEDDDDYESDADDVEYIDGDDEGEKAGLHINTANNKVSAIPEPETAEDEVYKLLQLKDYQQRLYKRTVLLEEMRKSYLRDVVILKNLMKELLKGSEREVIMLQYDAMLPSLDMTQALAPHAPAEMTFTVKPCSTCGGHLEVNVNVTEKLKELHHLLDKYKQAEENLRLGIAQASYKYEKLELDKASQNTRHLQEKAVLYDELRKIKETSERDKNEINIGKKAARNVRDKMVDYHKLTFLLTATEKEKVNALEEIDMLKKTVRENYEKIDELENDQIRNRMILDIKNLKEELSFANSDKEQYLGEIEVMKKDYTELTDHQGRLKFRAEDLQVNLDKANLKIKEQTKEALTLKSEREREVFKAADALSNLKHEFAELNKKMAGKLDEIVTYKENNGKLHESVAELVIRVKEADEKVVEGSKEKGHILKVEILMCEYIYLYVYELLINM
jgi:hypothetical protein